MTSVDSGAVLTILEVIDADLTLHSIVFGESMLNDAVALVLFHTLAEYGSELVLTPESIGKLIGLFFGTLIGSITIGICVALVSKRNDSDRMCALITSHMVFESNRTAPSFCILCVTIYTFIFSILLDCKLVFQTFKYT